LNKSDDTEATSQNNEDGNDETNNEDYSVETCSISSHRSFGGVKHIIRGNGSSNEIIKKPNTKPIHVRTKKVAVLKKGKKKEKANKQKKKIDLIRKRRRIKSCTNRNDIGSKSLDSEAKKEQSKETMLISSSASEENSNSTPTTRNDNKNLNSGDGGEDADEKSKALASFESFKKRKRAGVPTSPSSSTGAESPTGGHGTDKQDARSTAADGVALPQAVGHGQSTHPNNYYYYQQQQQQAHYPQHQYHQYQTAAYYHHQYQQQQQMAMKYPGGGGPGGKYYHPHGYTYPQGYNYPPAAAKTAGGPASAVHHPAMYPPHPHHQYNNRNHSYHHWGPHMHNMMYHHQRPVNHASKPPLNPQQQQVTKQKGSETSHTDALGDNDADSQDKATSAANDCDGSNHGNEEKALTETEEESLNNMKSERSNDSTITAAEKPASAMREPYNAMMNRYPNKGKAVNANVSSYHQQQQQQHHQHLSQQRQQHNQQQHQQQITTVSSCRGGRSGANGGGGMRKGPVARSTSNTNITDIVSSISNTANTNLGVNNHMNMHMHQMHNRSSGMEKTSMNLMNHYISSNNHRTYQSNDTNNSTSKNTHNSSNTNNNIKNSKDMINNAAPDGYIHQMIHIPDAGTLGMTISEATENVPVTSIDVFYNRSNDIGADKNSDDDDNNYNNNENRNGAKSKKVNNEGRTQNKKEGRTQNKNSGTDGDETKHQTPPQHKCCKITMLVENGQAQKSGLRVNDVFVHNITGSLIQYDKVMNMIETGDRPLKLTVRRQKRDLKDERRGHQNDHRWERQKGKRRREISNHWKRMISLLGQYCTTKKQVLPPKDGRSASIRNEDLSVLQFLHLNHVTNKGPEPIPKLYDWLNCQRRAYRRSCLSSEQVHWLKEDIGVCIDVENDSEDDDTLQSTFNHYRYWETMFSRLSKYVEEKLQYSSCNRSDIINNILRIHNKVESIQNNINNNVEHLVNLHKNNSAAAVPSKTEIALSKWVQDQKYEYEHFYCEGKLCPNLLMSRVVALEAIGFKWDEDDNETNNGNMSHNYRNGVIKNERATRTVNTNDDFSKPIHDNNDTNESEIDGCTAKESANSDIHNITNDKIQPVKEKEEYSETEQDFDQQEQIISDEDLENLHNNENYSNCEREDVINDVHDDDVGTIEPVNEEEDYDEDGYEGEALADAAYDEEEEEGLADAAYLMDGMQDGESQEEQEETHEEELEETQEEEQEETQEEEQEETQEEQHDVEEDEENEVYQSNDDEMEMEENNSNNEEEEGYLEDDGNGEEQQQQPHHHTDNDYHHPNVECGSDFEEELDNEVEYEDEAIHDDHDTDSAFSGDNNNGNNDDIEEGLFVSL